MTPTDKARIFSELHIKGEPLVLYNIWDAGSAQVISEAGAKAIATGSWSVAAAQGYEDGEKIPLDFTLSIVSRIAASTDLPLSVDFEGGYSEAPDQIAKNTSRLMATGAIGVNFEDQRIGDAELYATEIQFQRIQAMRQAANDANSPLFINARTDLFLLESNTEKHADLIMEAKERAQAYKEAGANSFFVPGLIDPELIADLCETVALPLNVMMMGATPKMKLLASLGVARISFGPGPYRQNMEYLKKFFQSVE